MKKEEMKNLAPETQKTVAASVNQNLAVKEDNALSTASNSFDMSDFMDDGLSLDDIRLESLVVTQSNSKARNEMKDLNEGDIYLSVSRSIVAKKEQKIYFVPLYIKKLVQIFENKTKIDDPKLAQKGKYIETVPASAVPKSVPWVDEGFIRMQVRTVFGCMFSEGFTKVVPYKISFKSSSMKSLNPLILKVTEHINNGTGNVPYDLVFSVKTKKISNDQNSWFILDTEFERLVTEEEKKIALDCVTLVQSLKQEVLLDDSDVESVEAI